MTKKQKSPSKFEGLLVGLQGQIPQHLSKPQQTSKTLINIGFFKLRHLITPQKTLENIIL